ncbi:LysM peptidoglycan-binding domain-containing protein [Simkania negevensis]|uniref:LysM peptidoglycan-binding domain-containing protein n=1 Tax=Simkania negevensis TaxID=83561 RepID=A0ABS3AQT9_9BACT|nr:LysM peptidoglycan-binding domain-containing protein [Simkania negevensis]
MSRRDTIIIAVLINAGLLMILFVTAINSGGRGHKESSYIAADHPRVEKKTVQPTVSSKHEVLQPVVVASSSSSTTDSVAVAREEKVAPVEPEVVAVVAKEEKSRPDYVKVTVKRGDTLEHLAKANDTTVEKIMALNNMRTTRLDIGQVLRIEGQQRHAVASAEKDETREESIGEFYTVRSGDNPWLIALKHRIKLEDLLQLNDLDEKRARRLQPGDKIRIR